MLIKNEFPGLSPQVPLFENVDLDKAKTFFLILQSIKINTVLYKA
jgi:hypothetical protein